MIRQIAWKDLLLNLMTFKTTVGTIVCLILATVFVFILAKDYQQRLKNYNANVSANEANLNKVKVYKNIKPMVYRRPSVLSVFVEGLEKQAGKSAQVELGGVPEMMTVSEVDNPFLSAFPTLDVMLILKVVMSVLALLVAYDTISGEREQGTLRLILSGTAPRYHVLLGKLLAGLLTLFVPITGTFMVGLLVLQFFPMVHLSGADWVHIGLMYLTSLIFIFAMYNVSLLFSCLMKRSGTSLMLGLFVWIICAVVIPNVSIYLANYLRPTMAGEQLSMKVKGLIEERDNRIADLTKTLSTSGQQSFGMGPMGDFVLFCDERLLANYKKRYVLSEPVRIRYADRIFEAQEQYLHGLTRQKHLAFVLTQISPVAIYENIMSALAGTDSGAREHFRNEVKAYTNEVIEYIRSKTGNFSSSSYFTPTKDEDHQKINNEMILMLSKTKNYDVLLDWLKEKTSQIPSLDIQDFPQFICKQESLVEVLHRTIPEVTLLLFINVLLFTLSFAAFQKYDVR